jgi:hypothetical protein
LGAENRKSTDLQVLLGSLSGDETEGCTLNEHSAELILRKNRENTPAFQRTPYADRLILVPQCLRSTEKCQATEYSNEYICAGCGACKVALIVRRAGELGYAGVRILKGGSAVSRLLRELKPKAVLGIACSTEGIMGMIWSERAGLPVLCVPLSKDGCSDTDVALSEVMSVMESCSTKNETLSSVSE